MPDVTRFAGYESPITLTRDSSLSREDKISGLRTWRALLRRFRGTETGNPPAEQGLLDEIDRALAGLDRP